jgi:hypothetical protein
MTIPTSWISVKLSYRHYFLTNIHNGFRSNRTNVRCALCTILANKDSTRDGFVSDNLLPFFLTVAEETPTRDK